MTADTTTEHSSAYRTGHHWIILVLPSFVLAAGLLVTGYFGALTHPVSTPASAILEDLLADPSLVLGYLGWVIILYGLTGLAIALIKFFTMRIDVSDVSVEYQVGLFGKRHSETEITKIESVNPNQGMTGFFFAKWGLGSFANVTIRGVGTGAPFFAAVRNPYQLRDAIHQQIRKSRQ